MIFLSNKADFALKGGEIGLERRFCKPLYHNWSYPWIVSSSNRFVSYYTSHTDWMSGAKRNSAVYDSHQLAASQNKQAGWGKVLHTILAEKLYTLTFKLLWITLVDKFHIELYPNPNPKELAWLSNICARVMLSSCSLCENRRVHQGIGCSWIGLPCNGGQNWSQWVRACCRNLHMNPGKVSNWNVSENRSAGKRLKNRFDRLDISWACMHSIQYWWPTFL